MQNGTMVIHPYCGDCGTVKNVSSDRGRKLGYFITSLSRLKKRLGNKGYRVTDVQIRLISKELEEFPEFTDYWWITFSRQRELFVEIVRKYIRVSPQAIWEVL